VEQLAWTREDKEDRGDKGDWGSQCGLGVSPSGATGVD